MPEALPYTPPEAQEPTQPDLRFVGPEDESDKEILSGVIQCRFVEFKNEGGIKGGNNLVRVNLYGAPKELYSRLSMNAENDLILTPEEANILNENKSAEFNIIIDPTLKIDELITEAAYRTYKAREEEISSKSSNI